MEAVDHFNRLPKECFNGRGVRLGHIQHHDFNLVEFDWRTTLEPGDDVVSVSPFKRRNGSTFVQVDDRGVVTMSLAPGIFINSDGATGHPRKAGHPCATMVSS